MKRERNHVIEPSLGDRTVFEVGAIVNREEALPGFQIGTKGKDPTVVFCMAARDEDRFGHNFELDRLVGPIDGVGA